MKIYLPFNNVGKNLLVLSEYDLGHQRNCALTILETVAGKGKGWAWHPGVNMWLGGEFLLAHIAYKVNQEWAEQTAMSAGEEVKSYAGLVKAYQSSLADLGFNLRDISTPPDKMPWWWGNERFHQGEASLLVRHDAEWYRQFFPKTENDLCEWWPRYTPDQWVYGPQIGPNGDYSEYFVDEKPIYKAVRNMSFSDFAAHSNRYHNLLGSKSKEPIGKRDEAIGDSLRSLHDRFHQKRTYHTHDHLS